MIIAVDAMGGDHAPLEVCKGVLDAVSKFEDIEILLVGHKKVLNSVFKKELSTDIPSRVHVVHAEEVITMEDLPAKAFRKKKNSSMRIAIELVKSKEADAFVSAGNTGAIVAAGVLVLGRIGGIDRPGLGIPTPALNGDTFIIDVGATVNCKPLNLYQFAVMGSTYVKCVFDKKDPTVALLSNGEEDIKGDEVVVAAKELLEKSNLNYVGYVEGKDIPFGEVDVVVCDGFTGNVLLKFVEGVGEAVYTLLKREIKGKFLPKIGFMLMMPMLNSVWSRFNYERYGGAPLLGVKGIVIKAHGRSKAPAIANAIRVAREAVIQEISVKIEKGLEWR